MCYTQCSSIVDRRKWQWDKPTAQALIERSRQDVDRLSISYSFLILVIKSEHPSIKLQFYSFLCVHCIRMLVQKCASAIDRTSIDTGSVSQSNIDQAAGNQIVEIAWILISTRSTDTDFDAQERTRLCLWTQL
jgi:hypothetical protein